MASQRGTTAPLESGLEQADSLVGAGNVPASLNVDGAVRLKTSSVMTNAYAREFAQLFRGGADLLFQLLAKLLERGDFFVLVGLFVVVFLVAGVGQERKTGDECAE